VLDRASEDKRGGSTAWTTAGLRIDDDSQLDPGWAKLVRETSGHLVNEEYIDAFYENAIDTLNWIRRHGVKTISIPSPVPNGFGKRAWFIEGGGRAVIDTLTPKVTNCGGTIFYETTARDLVTDASGTVTGLVVHDSEGNLHTMITAAVLLACGGFEANPEMLSRYIPNAHRLKPVSPGTMVNKGDGIRMAVAVGADTAGQFDRAHLEPVDPRSDIRASAPTVRTWRASCRRSISTRTSPARASGSTGRRSPPDRSIRSRRGRPTAAGWRSQPTPPAGCRSGEFLRLVALATKSSS